MFNWAYGYFHRNDAEKARKEAEYIARLEAAGIATKEAARKDMRATVAAAIAARQRFVTIQPKIHDEWFVNEVTTLANEIKEVTHLAFFTQYSAYGIVRCGATLTLDVPKQ